MPGESWLQPCDSVTAVAASTMATSCAVSATRKALGGKRVAAAAASASPAKTSAMAPACGSVQASSAAPSKQPTAHSRSKARVIGTSR